MKYAWVAKNKAAWPITMTCEALGVSASGYFEHQRRGKSGGPSKPGGARLSNEALLAHIRAIHAEVKGEYGWPRLWKELLAHGIRVGKDRVQRLMKMHGIKARGKRKFVVTTDSRHDLPVTPNLLARDFSPAAPDQVWSSDVTYIATDEGWLYLAVVIDLFSRQVVGWSMQPHMHTSLVTDALRMAWFRRHPAPGLVFHSDRGSQGEFNPSSQHVLIGGVDELQEVEVGSVTTREAPLAGETASVASRRAVAVLEGDLRGALQRGRGRHRWCLAGRWQQMVPTMRRYATIESCTFRARADGPLHFLR